MGLFSVPCAPSAGRDGGRAQVIACSLSDGNVIIMQVHARALLCACVYVCTRLPTAALSLRVSARHANAGAVAPSGAVCGGALEGHFGDAASWPIRRDRLVRQHPRLLGRRLIQRAPPPMRHAPCGGGVIACTCPSAHPFIHVRRRSGRGGLGGRWAGSGARGGRAALAAGPRRDRADRESLAGARVRTDSRPRAHAHARTHARTHTHTQ
jgi:hypothetical protein